ncbi:MAG: fructosamine kinase family protein [Phycisphaerales bacterium]
MSAAGWRERVEEALGARVVGERTLGGGCVGDVRRVELKGRGSVVVKAGEDEWGALEGEGWGLGYLREKGLACPRVLVCERGLLVMEWVESDGGMGESVERDAAEKLARLHGVREEHGRYGMERDTPIGGLRQRNEWGEEWGEFFGEKRLVAMAEEGARVGMVSGALVSRVRAMARRLGEMVEGASGGGRLVHGDVWGGNVLTRGGRVAGFIDAAAWYAHPEVELAFITLFGTFGRAFFERYEEVRGEEIERGFWEGKHARRDVYNVYPLLVHARLFGGGYVGQVESALGRMGF